MLLLPLVAAAAVRGLIVRLGLIRDCWTWRLNDSRQRKFSDLPSGVLRRLGLAYASDCPPLVAASCVAIISSLVVIGLWPLIREVGLHFALAAYGPDGYTFEYSIRSMTEAFVSSRRWLRLWQWELWSLGRWWLLFAGVLVAWLSGFCAVFAPQWR